MTEVKSSYLNTFVGACIDVNKPICCVWEYCTKGSLQDVIFNESIKLDDMFKFSISIDILKVNRVITTLKDHLIITHYLD